jgi:tetratricopeptide (TPR) repeat protein
MSGTGQVAHLAHLTGYAYGFGLGMGLLWIGLLERESFDMLSLLAQRRRRAQFARMTRGGFEPWAGTASPTDAQAEKPPDPRQQEMLALRAQIIQAIEQHDLSRAAELFDQLQELEPTAVLSQQQQLDLANHYMSAGRYESAAHAYEMLLSVYVSYPQREQVQLILGLIYARYLRQPQRANELLTEAAGRLRDPEQQRLARQVLEEVRA